MQFLTNLDLSKNELQNAVIQPLATAPANPKLGQVYFDTAENALMQYKESGWARVGVVYNQTASTGAVVSGLDDEGTVTTKNVIELTLTGYTPVDGGVVATGASLGTAIHDLDEELKNVIAGGGEPNQEAWSYINVGETTISASAKKDTFKVIGSGAATVAANASTKTITVGVSVDSAMSTTSTNPVQNKTADAAIKAAQAAAETTAKNYTDTKDTAMGTRVTAVETGLAAAEATITKLDGADTVAGSVKKQIKDAIAAEDTLAQGYASDAEDAAKAYADEIVGDLDGELAAVAKSGMASDVTIIDEAGKLTADNVEAAIAELITMIDAGGSGSAVTVEKDTTVSGIAARYTIKQGGTAVSGGVIDIPKDMVVKSGRVEVNPTGKPAGTYLVLVLQNATEDEIYINVSSLIDIYTAGDDTTTGHVTVTDRKIQMNVIDGSIGSTQLDSTTNATLAVVGVLNGSASTDGSVKKQIATAKAEVETEIDNLKNGEVADNTAAIEALDGRVEDTEDAIELLNGADTVTGSVKQQIKTAKTAVEAEITALENGAVADNTAAIAALEESKADKADVDEIPVVKVATATLAVGGTSASVSYSGTVINTFVKDASGAEVVTDVTIGTSAVSFSVAQAATAALTCVVLYF